MNSGYWSLNARAVSIVFVRRGMTALEDSTEVAENWLGSKLFYTRRQNSYQSGVSQSRKNKTKNTSPADLHTAIYVAKLPSQNKHHLSNLTVIFCFLAYTANHTDSNCFR